IDEAGVAGGKRRQGGEAVGGGVVEGGDGERIGRADGERARHERDRVVGGAERAGVGDGVAASIGGGRGGGDKVETRNGGGGVAVDESAEGRGEGGIGRTVGARKVTGADQQRRPVH